MNAKEEGAYYFGDEEGVYLVKLARRAIESYLLEGKDLDVDPPYEKLGEKFGAFVTLTVYPTDQLRGCIGYSEPIFPLYLAIANAAIAAAVQDPRFFPMRLSELGNIVIEVSLLTPLERFEPSSREDLPRMIEIGRHGLLVRRGHRSGLLLPQVAPRFGWKPSEFLDQTCIKAGLDRGCWKEAETEVYGFTAELFKEDSPNGEVHRESPSGQARRGQS